MKRAQVTEAPRTKAAKSEPNRFKRALKILGPGFVTGASDDDPSGIVTYTQAGASFGLAPLWSALFTFPLMATMQYICAKVALVTGSGLASVLRMHYPRWLLLGAVCLLVIANTVNAGADIAAIAACAHLLVPIFPQDAYVFPVTLAIVLTMVFGSYEKIANILKWLTLSLCAYIGTIFFVHVPWEQVLWNTFVPHVIPTKEFLSVLVAILGTTISPYLFFWQTSQEIEEQRKDGMSISERKGATDDDLKYAAMDVNAGMFLSNVVMYFIILASASTMHGVGATQIRDAAHAASALKPIAGAGASVLFSLGVIATGILAVPVLVGSAAFAVSEAFGWRRGLNEKWYRAKKFYLVIAIASAVGMEMSLTHVNTMAALFWTAVLNGVLAPPLMVVLMLVSNNKSIMGNHVNSKLINALGGAATLLMFVAVGALIWTSLH